MALRTKICDLFRVEFPIVSAGMGGVALADLAGAVSEAGGLGTIALAGLPPDAIHQEVSAARKITKKPIAVNLLVPFLYPGAIEAAAREPVSAVTFFWGDPAETIAQAKRAGIPRVIWQCGSAREAVAAKNAGADAIIAQGFEAGGHVRGIVTTLALIPEVRDAIGQDFPLLAAGGFSDGRGLAAALALGADGAVFGTRFLASNECAAHPLFKQAVLKGHAEDTIYSTMFDVGWPDAPHRALRNSTFDAWERAGRPPTGKRPGEGERIGVMRRPGIEAPIVRYGVYTPGTYYEGDIEPMALYAGQSVSQVREIKPAAQIVRDIARETQEVIDRLAPLAR